MVGQFLQDIFNIWMFPGSRWRQPPLNMPMVQQPQKLLKRIGPQEWHIVPEGKRRQAKMVRIGKFFPMFICPSMCFILITVPFPPERWTGQIKMVFLQKEAE